MGRVRGSWIGVAVRHGLRCLVERFSQRERMRRRVNLSRCGCKGKGREMNNELIGNEGIGVK